MLNALQSITIGTRILRVQSLVVKGSSAIMTGVFIHLHINEWTTIVAGILDAARLAVSFTGQTARHKRFNWKITTENLHTALIKRKQYFACILYLVRNSHSSCCCRRYCSCPATLKNLHKLTGDWPTAQPVMPYVLLPCCGVLTSSRRKFYS